VEVVKNKARAAVTELVVISEAKPETFDILGLTAEQMALLVILTGCSVHPVKGDIYMSLVEALGVSNASVCNATDGFKVSPKVEAGWVTAEHINYLLNSR